MKSKDFRTIKSVLKEYGMTSGVSTPVGQQSSGASAKANKVSKSPSQEKSPSPTMQGNVSPSTKKLQRQQQAKEEPFNQVDAGEQELDTVLKDKEGNEVGTVVSRVGDKPNADAIVIKDPKNQFRVVDPDEEMFVDNPEYVEEKSRLLSKDRKTGLLKKKIKKLVRKNKLREQGTEQLFEINFNQKSIAKDALKMPIKCGFEAETSWESVYGSDDEDGDWLYEYNWYDIEDMLIDQEGRSAASEIEEGYDEWVREKAYDLEPDFVQEIATEREEDEYYLNLYIEDVVGEDDIEEYKERILDDLPEEDHDEYEDWDFMAWGRQYVEEELLDDYREWLEEGIRDEGEAMDRAYDQARDDYDIDTWANDEYGSWSSCLSEYGYYLSNPDGEGGGQEEVAGYLRDWAEDNSITDEVQAGEYHAGYGDTKQSYWRVEGDPSISTGGTGSEIISPVYKNPQAMLKEMKSLFEWLDDQNVETNSSTGLHVTMSMNSEPDAPRGDDGQREGAKVNKVKMAVLLGDKYLLSTFGRSGNTYAKSQYDNLKRRAGELKRDPNNTKNIRAIEQILSKGISSDKYSAINFKGDKDRSTNNELIEFRIGGGHDYHQDFDNCAKAVIRYATVMSAGHDDKAFQKQYASALFRFVNKLDKIDDADIERAKGDIEHPSIDVLKDFFGKDNYVSGVQNLNHAFYNLDFYKKFSDPEADKKWKKDVKDYEKATGDKVQIDEAPNSGVETAEPIRGYIRPESTPPSQRAKGYLEKAQKYFLTAILQAGYDLNQNLNRKPITAKGIGILRKVLPQFELDYKEIDTRISALQNSIDYGGDSYPDAKTRMQRLKNGIDRLFKKDVISMPEFLTHAQVDKLISGLWNALHSKELQDGNKSKEFFKLYGEAKGVSPELIAEEWDDYVRGTGTVEFNEFYGAIQRGHRDSLQFSPGEPINGKGFDKFLTHLKQYPEWNHPVAKGHNPAITGGDSYQYNAISKLMVKLRTRWDAIESLKDDEPAKYYDIMKKLGKMGQALYDVVKETDGSYMDALYPELKDTKHARYSADSKSYIAMSEYSAERWNDILDGMARGTSAPFDDSPVMQMRDRFQEFVRGCLDAYYEKKKDETDFYDHPTVQALVDDRFDAIKTFLTDLDKIAQDIGFDSQADAIAQKRELDTKQKNFKDKHGPKNLYTIPGFSFGGDVYVKNDSAEEMLNLGDDLSDRNLYDRINFARVDKPHGSQYHTLKLVPNSDYFLALDANEMVNNERLRGTWRIPVAEKILKAFYDRYSMQFDTFNDRYTKLSAYSRFARFLKNRRVTVDDSLGDGRVGQGGFGNNPFDMTKEELEGPHGEPFSLSAAASWKVNNPELAKKIDAEEKKRLNSIDIQIPIQAGVSNNKNLEGASSDGLAQATDWYQLAKYMKIEAGVNDQGVRLFKQTYEMYDGNSSGDFAAEGYGVERFVDAVKKAKAYIDKNYKVSAGNYFRDEDYVGARLGGPETADADTQPRADKTPGEPSEDDYINMRRQFPTFDRMMSNGMQNYMVQPDVNRLIQFLNNPANEQTFKLATLQAMEKNVRNGGEPADIQQALAMGRNAVEQQAQRDRIRMMSRESVFTKFDNLSLQEKLNVLEKSEVLEKWSKKYKSSIDCNNPKGFSQKAHCAGKKKKKKTNETIEAAQDLNALMKGIDADLKQRKKDLKKLPKKSVYERPLTKGEESDKEKYVKGMKKNAKDFKKRYGKDAKAVMYATATKMAKESIVESTLPANDRVSVLNYLLADHLPASDLQKQFWAYWAVPVPAMIDAFRDARSSGGDKTCLRPILRGFAKNYLPDSELKKIKFNEA